MRRVLTLAAAALLSAGPVWAGTNGLIRSTQTVAQGQAWDVRITQDSTAAYVTAENRLKVETLQVPGTTATVQIAYSSYTARVDASGRLLVVVAGSEPPPATTAVSTTVFTNIAVNTTVDTYYTIASGKTLVLQEFNAANSYGGAGKYCIYYLYNDHAGTMVNPTLLRVWFAEGGNVDAVLTDTLVGDGTRRLVMRATTSGSAFDVYRQWKGYEK